MARLVLDGEHLRRSLRSFTYWHLKSATDVSGMVQWTNNLAAGSWQSTGISTQVITDEPTREQIKATLTIGAGDPQKFLRLRVE